MAKFKNEEGTELTLDQILGEDSEYQAEFDKKIAKALEKNKTNVDAEVQKKLEAALATREDEIRKNIQDEMEAKQKEAEENAKLTEAEKYKKELDKVNQKMLGYENQIALRNRQDKIDAYIEEKGYDPKIRKFINASTITDEQIQAKVDEVNDTFSDSVSKALDAKLKEEGDTILGNKGKKEGPQFEFAFTPIHGEKK